MKLFSIKHTCIRCGNVLSLSKIINPDEPQEITNKQKIDWRIDFSKYMYHHYINHSLIIEDIIDNKEEESKSCTD